ncbi:uncharacterized protein [Leptinotarsa decemlineata]|uniref:uncharacterized protein n=1 Tax=Leptinotarsa decemlineata TaxID=7539 RepID=UPI003D309DD8
MRNSSMESIKKLSSNKHIFLSIRKEIQHTHLQQFFIRTIIFMNLIFKFQITSTVTRCPVDFQCRNKKLKNLSKMSVREIKVAPFPARNASTDNICFCRTLLPVLSMARLIGLFPIIVKHQGGQCVFQKSLYWSIYTFGISCLFSYDVVFNIDYREIIKPRSLLLILEDVTNATYALYIVIATILILMKASKVVETLNKFSKVFKYGVYCSSAKKIALATQYGIVTVFLLTVSIQAGAYTWLHLKRWELTHFTMKHYFLRLSQSMTFGIYAQFCTFISMLIGALACFEKLTMSALRYIPVHPMQGIDETSNRRDFLGLFHFELCKKDHLRPVKWASLRDEEIVENLRIAHEEICLCIYDYNDCVNPLFLVHTVVELTLLIVHWYAVVAYVVYTFEHPAASTIHIINCIFVVLHTWGIYIFLKNAQNMKNNIQGLNNFLLEYSTRISRPEDHQQVRFFIEKLKQHRPFTASGVFTLDLGIAGPISASILTYVLVALQFDLPEE